MGDTRTQRTFKCKRCGVEVCGFYSAKIKYCPECKAKRGYYSSEYHRAYAKKHREAIREKNSKSVADKKAAGMCTVCGWGVPAMPGCTLCEKHLLARRNRRGRKTSQWQEEGMCSSCGRYPAEPGLKSCARCMVTACKGARERGERGKKRIVEYLGGKCQRCGLVTDCMPVYEIHHLSKKNKDFNMKTIRGWSWEAILKELDKGVQLLCANCHRIIQYGHDENWANKSELLWKDTES